MENGPALGKNFRFSMKDAFINLHTVNFEPRLREKWLGSIQSSSLMRSFQASKTIHFNMKKGVSNARYSSIFSYSTIPNYLLIAMVTETGHEGNYQRNRLAYKHYDLSSLSVFKQGLPLKTNCETVGMKFAKDNFFHQYWYQEFLRFFGPSAVDVTPYCFLEDLFCLCVNLSNLPLLPGDKAIVLEPEDRTLSFVSGGSVDVLLEFSKPLEENTMCYFIGFFDLVTSFDQDGLVIQ